MGLVVEIAIWTVLVTLTCRRDIDEAKPSARRHVFVPGGHRAANSTVDADLATADARDRCSAPVNGS